MNRQQLEYFLAVAEHGSLGHAAVAAGVSQPSLSQALGTLEKEMGAALVRRVRRGAVLTPAGHAFVPHARLLLRELRRTGEVIGRPDGGPAGELDLVTTPVLAVDPCAPLLGRFRGLHPEVRVRVQVTGRDAEVPGMLADGRAELGLVCLPLDPDGIVVRALAEHEIMAVFPPGEPPPPDPLPVRWLAGRETVGVTGRSRRRELVGEGRRRGPGQFLQVALGRFRRADHHRAPVQRAGDQVEGQLRVGPGAQFAPLFGRRHDPAGHALLAVPQRLLEGLGEIGVAGRLGLEVGDDLGRDRVAQGAGRDLVQQAQVPLQGAGVGHREAGHRHRRDHVQHQVELGTPAPVHRRLADTGPAGDALDRHAGVADGGQFLEDRRPDGLGHVLPEHGGPGGRAAARTRRRLVGGGGVRRHTAQHRP